MFEHDRFEELASLAAIRELSPEEQEQFEQHREVCPQCRLLFDETSAVAAGLFLAGSPRDENKDSHEERHQRLRKAISRQLPKVVPRVVMERYRQFMAAAVAAAFLLGTGIGVGVAYKLLPVKGGPQPTEVKIHTDVQPSRPPAEPLTEEAEHQAQALIADLQSKVEQGRRENSALEEKLTAAGRYTAELQVSLAETQKQSAEHGRELTHTREELGVVKDQLGLAKQSVSASEAKIASLEYKLADRESRLAEVTASLDREREMLSEGREVRDIMGARDLHIVDVIDRDGKGRVRKAFGRAFYTQGKSLIFYAFDLPTKSTADGRFVYAAWGSNSNNLNSKAAHSLGIFYNDDQTQHRWAMKFEDPKILEEIDTVFVTLEPAGKPFASPTGKPLLEAYFGTPPNHP